MTRYLVAMAAATLLAAACTGSDRTHDDLLAVVNDVGDVVVVTPEGDPVSTLTDLGESVTAFQPVWSGPDHLVFIEQSAFGGAMVVSTVDGEPIRRVEFVTPPFYAYPRPGEAGDADIVTLRNRGDGGLAAEVVHEDESVVSIGGSFPFFFTWTHRGELIAHSGNSALLRVYPDDRATPIIPGPFGAPAAWDGSIVHVREAGSTSYLSVLTGEQTRDVASLGGPTHLVVGGDRVALRSVAAEMPAGGIEIAAQQLPLVPADALAVVGLDDGGVEIVARGGIAAFFWDPEGTRLLYLDVLDEAALELAWHVWENGVVVDYPPFIPDPSWWLTFAPFFDQYAQSMSLWSPDGSAFAYPGRVGEETGVWVQHLDDDAPVRVSSGSWVAWGPAR